MSVDFGPVTLHPWLTSLWTTASGPCCFRCCSLVLSSAGLFDALELDAHPPPSTDKHRALMIPKGLSSNDRPSLATPMPRHEKAGIFVPHLHSEPATPRAGRVRSTLSGGGQGLGTGREQQHPLPRSGPKPQTANLVPAGSGAHEGAFASRAGDSWCTPACLSGFAICGPQVSEFEGWRNSLFAGHWPCALHVISSCLSPARRARAQRRHSLHGG